MADDGQDELAQLLMGGQSDPSLFSPNRAPGGIQENLYSPHEIAAYRNKYFMGGPKYRDWTPEQQDEQQYKAAKLMGSIAGLPAFGAGGLPFALMGGGITGGTSIMEGKPGEAVGEAALSALPYGLGKLSQVSPLAARTLGSLFVGSQVMTPSAVATDKPEENPFKWDEKASQARIKAAEKAGNAKTLREVMIQESTNRSKTLENAANWDQANQGRLRTATDLASFKQHVEPDLAKLKPEVASQVRNATTIEGATKAYNTAMSEYTNSRKTTYEQFGPEIEAAGVMAGILGGAQGYRIPASRTRDLRKATGELGTAINNRYGPGAPTNATAQAQFDTPVNDAANDVKRLSALGAHPSVKAQIGSMALPWGVSTFVPNSYDWLFNQYGDIQNKAAGNIIPGYNRASPDAPWYDRDWGPGATNALKSGMEGVFTHAIGGGFAGGKDYAKAQALGQSKLDTLADAQEKAKKMADALKRKTRTPKAAPIPNAAAAPPAATPIPSAPATPPAATPVKTVPAGKPDMWPMYRGGAVTNFKKKYNLPPGDFSIYNLSGK